MKLVTVIAVSLIAATSSVANDTPIKNHHGSWPTARTSDDPILSSTINKSLEFDLREKSINDGEIDYRRSNDILDIAKTLTSEVSKFVSKIGVVSDVLSAVKLVASFFRTSYTTETNEHYWEELVETAQAMVNEAIDDTIIKQTNDAVDRLSENLEVYIENNSTEGDFSALELTKLMDSDINNIISLYAGINHAERAVMHYLDMATTRLSLWQATSLRYIEEYSIGGQTPSGDDVCDIIRKWDMAFSTEANEIANKLRPALDSWNVAYRDMLSMSCEVTYEHPAFKEWRRQANCKIFDGYHAIDVESWHNRCHQHSDPTCPGLEWICFNYCNYGKMYPHIDDNNAKYNDLVGLVNTMTSNFLVVQNSQLDYYKDQCGIETEVEQLTTETF